MLLLQHQFLIFRLQSSTGLLTRSLNFMCLHNLKIFGFKSVFQKEFQFPCCTLAISFIVFAVIILLHLWKENQNGVGITKRTLQSGAGKPLKKYGLCMSQPGWSLTFDMVGKSSRTSARNSRSLLDPYSKITSDSLSTYRTPILNQLVIP